MKTLARIISASACLGIFAFQAASANYSRSYNWGFEKGTLISNWSFEDVQAFWSDYTSPDYTVDTRYKPVSGPDCKTGSYSARITGYNPDLTTRVRLSSQLFPLKPNQDYTLSFYYKTGTIMGNTWPQIFLSPAVSGAPVLINGANYAANSTWTLYVFNFSTQSNMEYAIVYMAVSNWLNHGGEFFFDDVILEEGSWLPADIVQRRTRIAETIGYSDGFGRGIQSQTKLPGSSAYLTSGVGLDDFGRPDTSFLPTPVSGPGFTADLKAQANTYYDPWGEYYESGYPDAGGYAYSRVKYADEPVPRIVEAGSAGPAWQPGSGVTRTKKSGYYFDAPSSAQGNCCLWDNLEQGGIASGEGEYRFDWSRNEDSSFSVTWTDQLGRVIKRGRNRTRAGGAAGAWSWANTLYEYYPSGLVRKTITPLDNQGVGGGTGFNEVAEYNALGQVISSYNNTKGLIKYWYNRQGQIRFTQDPLQRTLNTFTYFEYDNLGRLISKGTQIFTTLTQDEIDQDALNYGIKMEAVGYIYDDLSTFSQRSGGFTLDEVMPQHYYLSKKFTWGRLACAYNKNPDNPYPMGYTARDRFVADFYDYDQLGNATVHLKSIGSVKDSERKFQDAYFAYDVAGRLTQSYNYESTVSGVIPTSNSYEYDMLGRVTKISTFWGIPLAEFNYCAFGPLCSVLLGGDGTGTKGTEVIYSYHILGGIKSIKAKDLSTGTYSFEQFLGYENKAYNHASIPNTTPKYDGITTQQLYHFANDVVSQNPVRLANYDFDHLGRMLKADFRKNSNSGPLNSYGEVDFSTLTWNNSQENDSYLDYDLNGRITGQRSGGVAAVDSAVYSYQGTTYKLDHVTGKVNNVVTRDMSPIGTFVYDQRGNMINDHSKEQYQGMFMEYNWANQLMSRFLGSVDLETYIYDAAGNLVSRIPIVVYLEQATHYIKMGPGLSREWRETYDMVGNVASTSQIVNLIGRGAQIGRVRTDGVHEFFIKNHLGSTMKTVDINGQEPVGGGNDYDYLAYGDLRKIKENATQEKVTPKYTGKEYDEVSRLYNFGARFYDSELGVWTGPDAAGQYFSPYAYGPGNPMTGVDLDGYWWNPLDPDDWSDAGDGLISLGGSILITAGGITACIGTVGNVCFVGTYDHSNGEIEVAGGGLGGGNPYAVHAEYKDGEFSAQGVVAVNFGLGGIYGGAGRVDTRTGNYGLVLGGAHYPGFTGGYLTLGGNYNTNEFMLSGAFISLPMQLYTPVPFTLHRTREDGFGGSILLAGEIGPRHPPGPASHHNRNQIGNNYDDAPQTLEEILNDPNWEQQGEMASLTHGGSGYTVFNGKGKNRGRQLVYGPDGQLVTSGPYQGTYDYVPPDESAYGHFEKDMLPWVLFGN